MTSSIPQSDNPPTSPRTDVGQADTPADEGQAIIQTDYLEYIDEALEESMPASDPPAWTPTTSIGPPIHDSDEDRG